MPKGLAQSVLATTVVTTTATVISSGIIFPYRFDIFNKCVTGEYGPTSNICTYGPQISINILAAMLFFAIGAWVMHSKKVKLTKMVLGLLGAVSFILFWLLTASWRLQVSLGDNLRVFNRAPVEPTEHLWVLYQSLDVVLIGIILGIIVWIPQAFNANAIDTSKRKDARVKFPAPKKKSTKKK